jgi:hypothetical protein
MLDTWIDHCMRLSTGPASFFMGGRKIIRGVQLKFTDMRRDLVIKDCGFSKSKVTALIKLYKHDESIAMAQDLWATRRTKGQYGSAGFSTYNHLVKVRGRGTPTSDPNRTSGIVGSVMGPCLQSITLTLLKNHKVGIDCFYRTTEFYKKFPADLILIRDHLLPGFDIKPLEDVTFHFANVTCHPMYFMTVVPHFEDPIYQLQRVARKDPTLHTWIIKWSSRYILKEHSHGVEKFAQADRCRMDAFERIPRSTMRELQQYMRANHPGYQRRGRYESSNTIRARVPRHRELVSAGGEEGED